MPEKVLVREEIRNPITKNVNAVSLCRIESEKVKENNEVIDKSIIEQEKRSIKEPIRIANKEPLVDMEGNFVIPCNVGGLKYIDALVDQGSDVNVMPLSTYNRLTDEKLVETDIRLSLASRSHIYPLGIVEDVLVEISGFVYPVDFAILDIKEDRKNPFILGTPFLTTAKAKIKFDKGIITLKSSKSKVNFHKCPEFFCKFKEEEKDE
ncbi:MAK10-like protein [Tanacetum coccineum]